jgi:ornithine cyclodeaminase
MRHFTEAELASALDFPRAIAALREAFVQHARGEAQIMPRQRIATELAGVPVALSAMGAILGPRGALPGVSGTKVYSTHPSGYRFLVNLFDAASGAPLAVLEANEFTRLRTAAASGVALDLLARPEAGSLAIFGAGIQARAHAEALAPLRPFRELLVCARRGAEAFARELQALTGLPARAVDAEAAAREADVIACCTRSATPLFDGAAVRPGALVIAVGTSLPTARELDDALLARAALIAVEWREAAEREAGELVLAAPGVLRPGQVRELGELLLSPPTLGPDDVVVYKSVGVGLEDVALARAVVCG